MNSVNKLTETVAKKMGKSADRLLKHKYLNLLVVLLIALYAGMAAPALPNIVIRAVDSTVGKLVFLFLIGFVASENIQVALMVAVAFVVTLHVANTRATERFISLRTTERFEGQPAAPQGVCEAAEDATDEEKAAANKITLPADCAEPNTWTPNDATATATTSGGFTDFDPTTDAAFTDFDPTAQNFSNFEGFWEGAEGSGESDGADNTEEFSVYPDSGSKYANSLF